MQYLDFANTKTKVSDVTNTKTKKPLNEVDYMVLLARYRIDRHMAIIGEYNKVTNEYSLYVQKDNDRTERKFFETQEDMINAAKLIYLYHTGLVFETGTPYTQCNML